MNQVDLHGLSPDQALRRLSQELHSAKVQGVAQLQIITGRGWGNREQAPILRSKVEIWLGGPNGKRFGVMGFRKSKDGGSLVAQLSTGGNASGGNASGGNA